MKTLITGFLARVLKIVYLAYLKTLRIEVINKELSPSCLTPDKNVIYAIWHAKTFVIFGCPAVRHRPNDSQLAILTMPDFKNTVFARWCELLNFDTVPVSGNVRVTIRLKNFLEKGHCIALALDGPKGPAGVARPGAFYLAQITRRPIVAIDCHYHRSFKINHRWDRYKVPLPFTRVTVTFNHPVDAASLSHDDSESLIKPLLGIT